MCTVGGAFLYSNMRSLIKRSSECFSFPHIIAGGDSTDPHVILLAGFFFCFFPLDAPVKRKKRSTKKKTAVVNQQIKEPVNGGCMACRKDTLYSKVSIDRNCNAASYHRRV